MRSIRRRLTSQRVAQVAIGGLLLALVRTLAEYYRLRHVRGQGLTLGDVTPYVTGGIIAALGTFVAVVLYFVGRYRFATTIVVVAVAVMLVYKVIVIGWSL